MGSKKVRQGNWAIGGIHLGEEQGQGAAAPAANKGKGLNYRPRVLVVDDSVKAVTPLNIIFQNLGCETHLVFDGLTAAEYIAKEKPDLVILDWKMPGCNGDETLIKAEMELSLMDTQEDMKITPISVVTFSSKSIIEFNPPKCENFHLVAHWQKPLLYSELMKKAAFLIEDLFR